MKATRTVDSSVRYSAQVDEFSCVAHGDCVDVAPEVFSLEGDIAEIIGDASAEKMLRAAESCPSTAIILTDTETGEQVYP